MGSSKEGKPLAKVFQTKYYCNIFTKYLLSPPILVGLVTGFLYVNEYIPANYAAIALGVFIAVYLLYRLYVNSPKKFEGENNYFLLIRNFIFP